MNNKTILLSVATLFAAMSCYGKVNFILPKKDFKLTVNNKTEEAVNIKAVANYYPNHTRTFPALLPGKTETYILHLDGLRSIRVGDKIITDFSKDHQTITLKEQAQKDLDLSNKILPEGAII